MDVVVGKDQVVFSVWTSLICLTSPYFERVVSGAGTAGATGVFKATNTVSLENEDAGAFGLFVEWAYTVSLCANFNRQTSADISDMLSSVNTTHFDLVRLWILAEHLEVPRCQNYAATKLFNMAESGNYMYFDVAPLVYEETAPGSPLRRLIVTAIFFHAYMPDATYFAKVFDDEFIYLEFDHDFDRIDYQYKHGELSFDNATDYFVEEN